MTKYYPVTELELYQIKNDCEYPNTNSCDGCEHVDEELGCSFKGANVLIDEVMERMEPVEVLEKWIQHRSRNAYELENMLHALRTTPDAVIARGKEEGWLK